MTFNPDYFSIENLLEHFIVGYISKMNMLDFQFHVTINDPLPEPFKEYPPLIRVGIRSEKVNRKAQELIKECFSDILMLDKPFLEREYGSTSKEILYEIVYKISEELFEKLKVLSRIH